MAPGLPGLPDSRREDPLGDTIGAVLTRGRSAQGLSQLQLAELLCSAAGVATLTRHEISRWERGERIPSRSWLHWLSTVLRLPIEVARRAAGDILEPLAVAGRECRDVTRSARRPRRLSDQASTTLMIVMRAPAAITDPASLSARTALLRRMDDLAGGADLADVVLAELHAATGPPDRLTGRYAAPVAELAQLASWVLADAGRHRAAGTTARTALRAATAAGDPAIAAYLAGCFAESKAEVGEVGCALRLAQTAAAAKAVPTAVRALTLHRLAYASALAGLRDDGEDALLMAERESAKPTFTPAPPWLYWLDELHLIALTGRCYAALGRPRLARALLTEALDTGQLRQRGRALCGAWLGLAHVEAGDLDSAGDAAGHALIAAVRSGSVRAARLVRVLDTAIRAADHQGVREYTALADRASGYLPDIRPATTAQEGSHSPRPPAGMSQSHPPSPPVSVHA